MRRPVSVQLTLRVPPALNRQLHREAQRRGLPPADLIRTCLAIGLDQLAERPSATPSIAWESAMRTVSALLARGGATAYRTALLRRAAGLSVDRWSALDAWFEDRVRATPTRSARVLAKEALVYFGVPGRVLPSLVRLAQRVRHRCYMRAKRTPPPDPYRRSGGGSGGQLDCSSTRHAQ